MDVGDILLGTLSSAVAAAGTVVGALVLLLRARWDDRSQTLMLAAAAGVMLGATFFSLLLPAIEALTPQHGDAGAAARVGAGILAGAITVFALNAVVPHEHLHKGKEGQGTGALGSHWLFVLAITIHNLPEGLSVGVASTASFEAGIPVMLGIGLQNMPEGLAVAAAMLASGASRGRAIKMAALTGAVEPIGGLVGALIASGGASIVPHALSFAGGAMLYVVSGEVIPETHRAGIETAATFALVVGFVVMMLLDALVG